MPVQSWPPPSAPSWPPPETGAIQTSDIATLLRALSRLGFTQSAPTAQERTAFFNSARCDEGHQVVGRMLVSPSNVRYPFAVCNNNAHLQLLVLWPPDYCMGGLSGFEIA